MLLGADVEESSLFLCKLPSCDLVCHRAGAKCRTASNIEFILQFSGYMYPQLDYR